MYKRSKCPDAYPLMASNRLGTRSMDKIKFSIPRPTLEKFKTFPLYQGSILWDNLSSDIQHTPELLAFKNRLSKIPDFETYPVIV